MYNYVFITVSSNSDEEFLYEFKSKRLLKKEVMKRYKELKKLHKIRIPLLCYIFKEDENGVEGDIKLYVNKDGELIRL